MLNLLPEPTAADFRLANVGRQFWAGNHWLVLGHSESDNMALERAARPGDLLFHLRDVNGPLALARPLAGGEWDAAAIRDAAALTASYAPKALANSTDGTAAVCVDVLGGEQTVVNVVPTRETVLPWGLESFADVRVKIRKERGITFDE